MAATTSTASSRKDGAVGRSGVNGHKPTTITVKGLKLVMPKSVPLSTFRAVFQDEATNADVVEFLTAVLGEEQMEKVWNIDLDMADGPLADQVNAVLTELSGKVQKALGLDLGE